MKKFEYTQFLESENWHTPASPPPLPSGIHFSSYVLVAQLDACQLPVGSSATRPSKTAPNPTPRSAAHSGTRVRRKNTRFCGKKRSVLREKRSSRCAVSYVYTERPCHVWTHRRPPGASQALEDRMIAVTDRRLPLHRSRMFFEGRTLLIPIYLFIFIRGP